MYVLELLRMYVLEANKKKSRKFNIKHTVSLEGTVSMTGAT